MVGQRGWRFRLIVALFLAPSLIPLIMFLIVPMLASVGLSFASWDLLTHPRWVGTANYRGLVHDGEFHAALLHTLYFVAGYLPLVFCGGLLLALALHQRLKGVAWLRTLYFLPVVTSWVVVALVWKWLLNPQYGIVNRLLGFVGVQGPGWWLDPHWAMPSIILASAWKDIGFTMVIFLAGLQAIPEEYYEAASLDGAGRWSRFRNITFPLLSPASFFVVVISLINNVQVFDQVWVMTQGGPAGSTSVVVQQIVQNAFSFGRMGYAAAMSWVLFGVILVITVVQLRLQKRWVVYA
ncbi:MAG: N-Acetyl-D-glucosamine transport system, permease protein 1 [Actinomycetia bacterium]|jgi:multiple sugar transport system permease protein|nr:N-Acetyl-D-glucosamine transport system, permease protein 1 [Actinomycetes bacterium]